MGNGHLTTARNGLVFNHLAHVSTLEFCVAVEGGVEQRNVHLLAPIPDAARPAGPAVRVGTVKHRLRRNTAYSGGALRVRRPTGGVLGTSRHRDDVRNGIRQLGAVRYDHREEGNRGGKPNGRQAAVVAAAVTADAAAAFAAAGALWLQLPNRDISSFC